MKKVAKSEFEYFHPESYAFQITRQTEREYTPISALQHDSAIEFLVPPTENIYLDLSRTYLYVRAKIINPNGTNIAAGTEVGPINNTLHSLFSNVEVELCGKRITDANGLYPYRAYIENLLSYGKEAQEHQLQSMIWYKDTAGQMEASHTEGNDATNLGLVSRARLFARSNEVEMIGRLHSGLFHQPRAISQNCKLKIKLTRSKDHFVLMSGADVTAQNPQVPYRLYITDARLFVRSLEMDAGIVLAHEQVLRK